MRSGTATRSILDAIYAALRDDLPDVPGYSPFVAGALNVPGRRPLDTEIEVFAFNESHPSTALSYGGIGGNAITEATTVIVTHTLGNLFAAAIYFGDGGRLWRVVHDRAQIEACINERSLRILRKQA